VPVPYLLFLEKQLTELGAFVRRLPVLDAAETWNLDASTDAWKTEPLRTIRTRRVPRNHVKAEATEQHPAQVEVCYEDIPVGRPPGHGLRSPVAALGWSHDAPIQLAVGRPRPDPFPGRAARAAAGLGRR
jgi:hypothetical protein